MAYGEKWICYSAKVRFCDSCFAVASMAARVCAARRYLGFVLSVHANDIARVWQLVDSVAEGERGVVNLAAIFAVARTGA